MLGSRLNGIKTHVHNMWHVGSGGGGGGGGGGGRNTPSLCGILE